MLHFGVTLALVFAVGFAGLYALLSTFAQALESLSTIRRKALLEENPARFGRILARDGVYVSRLAVRVAGQGAVLGGFLSLGSLLSAISIPEPWLVGAITLLLGWIVLEALVIRWVAGKGPEVLLNEFAWLIPVVGLISRPLIPFLSRLVHHEEDAELADEPPRDAAEKEGTKEIEVRALLDVAREEGILEKDEEELLSRAVDFGGRTVGEVMTPRPDMVVAEADMTLSAIADLFVKTKYTRIPLVEGGVDRPVGIVHVKDVFTQLRSPNPDATSRTIAREVLYAPESQTIATLLADFRRRRQHLAIVVDEYGTVTGLVTLEDLVEELVGEIADEHEDGLDPVIQVGEEVFSVSGRVRVSEVATLFGLNLPPAEYDTVAGLISASLGHIPRPGESALEEGLLFQVEEADRRRVYRVRVERAPVPAGRNE